MGLLFGIIGFCCFVGGDYKTACWLWIIAYIFRMEKEKYTKDKGEDNS